MKLSSLSDVQMFVTRSSCLS